MKIKGICYKAPILDGSGYSKAARDYILALHGLGVPLTIKPMTFESARPDLGEDGKIIYSLIDKKIDYNVVIIHSTPEFWEKNREEDKLNVGMTIWETTKLHKDWPNFINNNVDLLLVATDWNIEVFKNSGVTIPICATPHCTRQDTTSPSDRKLLDLPNDTYVFGFVSQFIERKNPLALLKAYWWAFQNNEDVALVIKTHRSNYSDPEKVIIRNTINRLKAVTVFKNYPKVYLLLDLLSEQDMTILWKSIDTYVSLDRGEGWGLSPFICGSYGKPVIATGFGGVNQYLKEDNSFLVNYSLAPVTGMPYNRWMTSDQLWAEADIYHAAILMREVYNDQEAAKQKGQKLKKDIKDNFSYEVIGNKLIKNIEEVL